MSFKFFSNVSGVMFEGKFYQFTNGELETSDEKLIKKLIDNNFEYKALETKEQKREDVLPQLEIEGLPEVEEPKKEIKKYSLRELTFKTKLDLLKIAEKHGLKFTTFDTKQNIIDAMKGADLIG